MNKREKANKDEKRSRDELSKESADVYAMKLHETIFVQLGKGSWVDILRVPGGWIYTPYEDAGVDVEKQIPVFVPFSKIIN